ALLVLAVLVGVGAGLLRASDGHDRARHECGVLGVTTKQGHVVKGDPTVLPLLRLPVLLPEVLGDRERRAGLPIVAVLDLRVSGETTLKSDLCHVSVVLILCGGGGCCGGWSVAERVLVRELGTGEHLVLPVRVDDDALAKHCAGVSAPVSRGVDVDGVRLSVPVELGGESVLGIGGEVSHELFSDQRGLGGDLLDTCPAAHAFSSGVVGAAAWMAASSSGVAPSSRRLSQYVRASSSVLNAGIGGGVGASGRARTFTVSRLDCEMVSGSSLSPSMWDAALIWIPPVGLPCQSTSGFRHSSSRLPAYSTDFLPQRATRNRRIPLLG